MLKLSVFCSFTNHIQAMSQIWDNVLNFLFSRWRRWWSRRGTATCWPSFRTRMPVTWLNLRTRRTSEPAPSRQSAKVKCVSSAVDNNRNFLNDSRLMCQNQDLSFVLFLFPVVFAVMALWGGDTVPHARTQEDAWRKMLAFLQENLYGSTKPAATS